MLHGPQQDVFDLEFAVPSECADRVARGDADLGILPVAEIQRLGLSYFPETGIACTGAVRSILLITKIAPDRIGTLAVDSSSRTSVMLTRVVLAEKYGCRPKVVTQAPDMQTMLDSADAALIIGDPALRIEPNSLPYATYDLGAEWMDLTGLPMVFAMWSGPSRFMQDAYRQAFAASCRFGLEHMDAIVRISATDRGYPEAVVRRYLTQHIEFELGTAHLQGVQRFHDLCARL
jgi:predicted solute-binding protein